jgi:hypothetical protein
VGLAPVAPEAGLSVGLILLALACVGLLALNKAYKFTIGALIDSMASMFDSLTIHIPVIGKHVGLGFIGDALHSLDNYVLEGIGAGIQQTEKGMHAVIGAMTWLLQETADQVAGLAEDTAKAFDYTKRILVPSLLGVALAPIVKELAHLGARTRTIILHPTTIVHKTVSVIQPGLKALEGKVDALEAKVASIGAAAPTIISGAGIGLTLPKPAAIPGDITRGLDSLWKESKRVAKVLTPAGIVGLVAGSVLARMGLSWLKCGNVDKVGKRVCKLNPGILDSLLAGLVAVFGTIGLVKFAEDVSGFMDEFSDDVTAFWRADGKGPGGDRALGQTGHTGK